MCMGSVCACVRVCMRVTVRVCVRVRVCVCSACVCVCSVCVVCVHVVRMCVHLSCVHNCLAYVLYSEFKGLCIHINSHKLSLAIGKLASTQTIRNQKSAIKDNSSQRNVFQKSHNSCKAVIVSFCTFIVALLQSHC